MQKLYEHFHGKNFYKLAAMTFMHIENERKLSMDQQLSIQRRTTVVQNWLRLRSIVETIFCGRRGIALRGHREDHTCMDIYPLANCGNVWPYSSFTFRLVTQF